MKKSGRPTYIIKDEESLIVTTAEIKGDHGLPWEINYLSEQLQHVVKVVEF